MKRFALIGKTLSHSFSQSYFEEKFKRLGLTDYSYELIEIKEASLLQSVLTDLKSHTGFNITFPYKEIILPFLDTISEEALAIGAVNCVVVRDQKLIGHNTDVYGFTQSIKPFLDTNHQRALILGTGGAAKAAAFALKKIGVDVYFVSRKQTGENIFSYDQLNEVIMRSFKCIVNATPLGTYPEINQLPPLPYEWFSPEHLAYDMVYNPAETAFLKKASQKEAIIVNGLSMLQLQAEKSWEIWNN